MPMQALAFYETESFCLAPLCLPDAFCSIFYCLWPKTGAALESVDRKMTCSNQQWEFMRPSDSKKKGLMASVSKSSVHNNHCSKSYLQQISRSLRGPGCSVPQCQRTEQDTHPMPTPHAHTHSTWITHCSH